MNALQWNNRRLHINSIPLPVPAAGEVLIKVNKAGICNTDLEITRGYYPFTGTLGHEYVGTITAFGSGRSEFNLETGQRVVSDINHACGTCKMCHANNPHHCLDRKTLGINHHDGAFAEYLIVPEKNLLPVPDTISDERAVFTEPLAAALQILEQVNTAHLQKVAVLGDGKLGLLICMALAASGLQVDLIGRHPENMALVPNPAITFLSALPEEMYALVIEATGNSGGFNEALSITRPQGTLVLKSTYAGELCLNAALLVVNEITLLGSRCGPMKKALELLGSGTLHPENLIMAEFDLREGVRAFAHAECKGILKTIITMS